jgi:hypothetical protein
LSDLRPILVDRYEQWLQKHSDGVEHEHPPNARTQKIIHKDITARAQALRAGFLAEEAKLELIEKQIKWRRQQLQAQDDVERRARTKVDALTAVPEAQDAAPTDYIFSASAAEAVKRKWQQQQLQAQDDVEGTQRKTAAAAAANPPDYTFSRKHTIVVSDAFSPEEDSRHHKSPSGTTRCGTIAFLLLALVVMTTILAQSQKSANGSLFHIL